MTTYDLLSPTLLHATAVFLVTLTIFQATVYAGIVGTAARLSALPPRTQVTLALVAAAFLAAWLGWVVLAVREPVTVPAPPPTTPLDLPLLLKMSAFAAAGAVALLFAKPVRALYAVTPPAWPIGFQTYRVAGVIFLWPFFAAGALPTLFALVAGIGDVLTGLAAPSIARALARREPGARARAIVWNCFGMLDFFVAVTAAVASRTTNIWRFPLAIVPLFIVPVGLLAHIYSLRNLAGAGDLAPEGRLAGLQARTT